MVSLADDIRDMPMGMQTAVPEGGGTLSGGQRQRLAIARALVRKPKILIFDEATSALDNRTQAIVTQSLENLRVTRVVIAHRLSTIKNADKIVVIQKGQVVETGVYATLMDAGGVFFQLMNRQII
jgi:ATP-binding cassette subfamily B protein